MHQDIIKKQYCFQYLLWICACGRGNGELSVQVPKLETELDLATLMARLELEYTM